MEQKQPQKQPQKHPTGGEKLVHCLEREGVEYIFGLSGGAAMPMFDTLLDSKIELILVRHEQGATHMADGYARSTGRPGVVLVTSGPGATNTVTGLLTALMDSSPVVVITGQTPTEGLGKDAFQEADVTGITYPVVKHSYMVKDPDDLPRIVREAFHIATTGRPGPVLIDMPKDVGQGPCDAPVHRRPSTCPATRCRAAGDADAASPRPRRYLSDAEAPPALRGPGGGDLRRRQGHHDPGREAARSDGDHAAGQGRCRRDPSPAPGHAGHARDRLREQGGGRQATSSWPSVRAGTTASPASLDEFCTNAVKIHVDIDPAEFNKMIVTPDVSILGDARLVLDDLMPLVERADTDAVAQAPSARPGASSFPLKYPKQGGLRAQHVLDRLTP